MILHINLAIEGNTGKQSIIQIFLILIYTWKTLSVKVRLTYFPFTLRYQNLKQILYFEFLQHENKNFYHRMLIEETFEIQA